MATLRRERSRHEADLAAALGLIEQAVALQRELGMEAGTADPLTRPLLDAAALFDEVGLRYALVGGIAAMFYGRARCTLDVEFVAALEP